MKLKLESLGPYQVHEEIGRGGTSIVFRATDTRTERDVALKVLPPQLAADESFLKCFLKEGKNASRLRHDNIVSVYEADEADGHHYIAMELIRGGTLSSFIVKQGRVLPTEEILSILSQIASALDYAHSEGFLHRDIKLSNVLMAEDDRIVLTDFGASKHMYLDSTFITAAGQSIGTPSFMSPEQITGAKLDYRTDVYSLGVIAYKLFTGRLPHSASSQPELLHKVVYEEPLAPEVVNSELPAYVFQALKRVLSKDPKQRFESAGQFVASMVAGQVWTHNLPPVDQRVQARRKKSNNQWQFFRKVLTRSLAVALIAVIAAASWFAYTIGPENALAMVNASVPESIGFPEISAKDAPIQQVDQAALYMAFQADTVVEQAEQVTGVSLEQPKLWLLVSWLRLRAAVVNDSLVKRINLELERRATSKMLGESGGTEAIDMEQPGVNETITPEEGVTESLD